MITVRSVGLNWIEILNIARATQGKGPLEKVSGRWIERLIRSEHSPLRFRQHYIEFTCPYWVAMHPRTHWVGVSAHDISATVVESSRTDITHQERDPNREVRIYTIMNAQSVLNVSRSRLCTKTSPETREVWQGVLDVTYCVDPAVVDACEPTCHHCKEFDPCERSF